MHESNRDKAKRLEKELREAERAHRTELRNMRVERDRAMDAMRKQATAFHALTVRLAMAYAPVTSTNASGAPNGYCLTLPPLDSKEAQRWKVYGENDADGTTRIGVALRDEPEDDMSEAEIEAKKEEGR